MASKRKVDDLSQRYRRLAAKLAATGPILQGTVTQRIIPRKQKEEEESVKPYGPYYQWTFKQAGKTATVNLSSPQAKRVLEAIQNNRRVEETLNEMRTVSRQICEATTEGVKRRKSGTTSPEALS
jgi:hypothetical protein